MYGVNPSSSHQSPVNLLSVVLRKLCIRNGMLSVAFRKPISLALVRTERVAQRHIVTGKYRRDQEPVPLPR